MLPEDRLQEALKQVEIVQEEATLTVQETDWLDDVEETLGALQVILERNREARDDAEVIDDA